MQLQTNTGVFAWLLSTTLVSAIYDHSWETKNNQEAGKNNKLRTDQIGHFYDCYTYGSGLECAWGSVSAAKHNCEKWAACKAVYCITKDNGYFADELTCFARGSHDLAATSLPGGSTGVSYLKTSQLSPTAEPTRPSRDCSKWTTNTAPIVKIQNGQLTMEGGGNNVSKPRDDWCILASQYAAFNRAFEDMYICWNGSPHTCKEEKPVIITNPPTPHPTPRQEWNTQGCQVKNNLVYQHTGASVVGVETDIASWLKCGELCWMTNGCKAWRYGKAGGGGSDAKKCIMFDTKEYTVFFDNNLYISGLNGCATKEPTASPTPFPTSEPWEDGWYWEEMGDTYITQTRISAWKTVREGCKQHGFGSNECYWDGVDTAKTACVASHNCDALRCQQLQNDHRIRCVALMQKEDADPYADYEDKNGWEKTWVYAMIYPDPSVGTWSDWTKVAGTYADDMDLVRVDAANFDGWCTKTGNSIHYCSWPYSDWAQDGCDKAGPEICDGISCWRYPSEPMRCYAYKQNPNKPYDPAKTYPASRRNHQTWHKTYTPPVTPSPTQAPVVWHNIVWDAQVGPLLTEDDCLKTGEVVETNFPGTQVDTKCTEVARRRTAGITWDKKNNLLTGTTLSSTTGNRNGVYCRVAYNQCTWYGESTAKAACAQWDECKYLWYDGSGYLWARGAGHCDTNCGTKTGNKYTLEKIDASPSPAPAPQPSTVGSLTLTPHGEGYCSGFKELAKRATPELCAQQANEHASCANPPNLVISWGNGPTTGRGTRCFCNQGSSCTMTGAWLKPDGFYSYKITEEVEPTDNPTPQPTPTPTNTPTLPPSIDVPSGYTRHEGKACQIYAGGDNTQRSLADSATACAANEACYGIVCPAGKDTECTLRMKANLLAYPAEDCYVRDLTWQPFGEASSKCEINGDKSSGEVVADLDACKERTAANGALYFSYTPNTRTCFFSLTCDKPVYGTVWPFRRYTSLAEAPKELSCPVGYELRHRDKFCNDVPLRTYNRYTNNVSGMTFEDCTNRCEADNTCKFFFYKDDENAGNRYHCSTYTDCNTPTTYGDGDKTVLCEKSDWVPPPTSEPTSEAPTCDMGSELSGYFTGAATKSQKTDTSALCSSKCCGDATCDVWIWRESDKGCYFKRVDANTQFKHDAGHKTAVKRANGEAPVTALKIHNGGGCVEQGGNLGTLFMSPTECLEAALIHNTCGDTIMWTPGYNRSWGCRCCKPGKVGPALEPGVGTVWKRYALASSDAFTKNAGKSCQGYANDDITARTLEESKAACAHNDACVAIHCPAGSTTGCTLRANNALVTYSAEDCYTKDGAVVETPKPTEQPTPTPTSIPTEAPVDKGSMWEVEYTIKARDWQTADNVKNWIATPVVVDDMLNDFNTYLGSEIETLDTTSTTYDGPGQPIPEGTYEWIKREVGWPTKEAQYNHVKNGCIRYYHLKSCYWNGEDKAKEGCAASRYCDAVECYTDGSLKGKCFAHKTHWYANEDTQYATHSYRHKLWHKFTPAPPKATVTWSTEVCCMPQTECEASGASVQKNLPQGSTVTTKCSAGRRRRLTGGVDGAWEVEYDIETPDESAANDVQQALEDPATLETIQSSMEEDLDVVVESLESEGFAIEVEVIPTPAPVDIPMPVDPCNDYAKEKHCGQNAARKMGCVWQNDICLFQEPEVEMIDEDTYVDPCDQFPSLTKCVTWKKAIELQCHWSLADKKCVTGTGEEEPVDPCSALGTAVACTKSNRGIRSGCVWNTDKQCVTGGPDVEVMDLCGKWKTKKNACRNNKNASKLGCVWTDADGCHIGDDLSRRLLAQEL